MNSPHKFRTRRGVIVFRLKKRIGGSVHFAESYSARWVRNGKQYYFPLGSTKREAGALADEIDTFLDLPMHTIQQAIERYNPDKWERMNPKATAATVGDIITAHTGAQKAIGLAHQTGNNYRACFLLFFKQALAHRRDGKMPTDEAVKKVSLAELTPRLGSDFKVARVKLAGDDKAGVERKKRSINSVIRGVCSMFSKSAREHYAHLTLPADLDKTLKALPYRRVEKKRYRLPPTATIDRVMGDAWQLRNGYMDDAGNTVAPDLNAYLMWLLAAHAGQRRNEAAHAVRDWIQPGTPPRVWVRSTPEFIAKGKDEGFAEVEQWVVDEIEALAGPALIMAGEITERYYETAARLNVWLKARGLGAAKGDKAVHALRALFGSYVATTKGIFTAQRALRHKTVDITHDHYADVILDKEIHRWWTERPDWAVKPAAALEVVSV